MELQILDCTLRDGGYCNNWRFGFENIKKVINDLVNANIEIIECGFLSNRVTYQADSTKFPDISSVNDILPHTDTKQKFVVMINYGEYDASDIPKCSPNGVSGIRVAFHKRFANEAISFCYQLKSKGYLVFLQPMVSLNYTDDEFVDLINQANLLAPYAFYIVDSFGTMRKKDISHYFYLVKDYLHEDIQIGFHSHNNFQSAFANASTFLNLGIEREVIVDTSIYGMGRGAGNLNTELFVSYINEEETRYKIKPLLRCMDEVINGFYSQKPWGYSLPNYLSASHLIHPNYASFLCEKNTLTIDAMDDIFSEMSSEKAVEYDEPYIENLYVEYMSRGRINEGHIQEFEKLIRGKKVLLIAPGKTAETECNTINDFVLNEKPVVISINHEYRHGKSDFVFVSNMRRMKHLSVSGEARLLSSSNIKSLDSYACFDYFELINSSQAVRDNAGLMAMRMVMNLGKKEIYLAGFDGYDYAASNNYEEPNMELEMSTKQIDRLNDGMQKVICEFRKTVGLHFITSSRFKCCHSDVDK